MKINLLKTLLLFALLQSCGTQENNAEKLDTTPSIRDTSYGKAFGEIYFGVPSQEFPVDTIFNVPFYPDGVFIKDKLTALLLTSSQVICNTIVRFSFTAEEMQRELKEDSQSSYNCEPKDAYIMKQIFESLKEKYGKGKRTEDEFANIFKSWDISMREAEFYYSWENSEKIIYLGFSIHKKRKENFRIDGTMDDLIVSYYPAILVMNKKLFNIQKGEHQIDSLERKVQENNKQEEDKAKF